MRHPANKPSRPSVTETLPLAVPPAGPVPQARVDLGPELPMAVFTSSIVWNPQRIGALAVYCSDGRWGEAFDEFCQHRLLLPRYDRLAVAGGPAGLAASEKTTDPLAQVLREQLALLVKVHDLERIILIAHYGCAFYGERLHQGPDECLPRQLDDLRIGARTLRGWFPSVRVETYLAMRRGSCLSFHWLNT